MSPSVCVNFQKRQNDSAVTESRSGVDLGWEIDGDLPGMLKWVLYLDCGGGYMPVYIC